MSLSSYKPNKCSTVPEWIRAGKALSLSRDSIMLKVIHGDKIYPYQSLTSRFRGALRRFEIDYSFTTDNWSKYIYQPKRFCLDFYGTPELWGDILYINHMVSALNFNKPNIKIYSSSVLEAIAELKSIYNDDLKQNQAEVRELQESN